MPRRRPRPQIDFGWEKLFSRSLTDRTDSGSGATAAAAREPRAGADARASSGDERRFETLSSKLGWRVDERAARRTVTRAADKAAGDPEKLGTRVEYQSDEVEGTSGAYAIDPEEPGHVKCQERENLSFSKFKRRKEQQFWDSSSVHSQKVQDVPILNVEDMETEGEVIREKSDKQEELNVCYPSRDEQESVVLNLSHLKCLEPKAFLSTLVIDFYILKIKREHNEYDQEKFFIFNVHFYGKLENCDLEHFSQLRRWWKGVNLFDKAYIILPVYGMSHWSLLIICIAAKESISGPIILHLDSLGFHCSDTIFSNAVRLLKNEWHQSSTTDIPVSETWEVFQSNILKKVVEVPQQPNDYDCGVFMLSYIERFISEAPERFTKDKLDMFSHSWFKPEDASELRQTIRQRITKLFRDNFPSAKLDDAMSDAAMSDGMTIEAGNTVKSNESVHVAAPEAEFGEPGDTGKCKSITEEAHGELGDYEFGARSPVLLGDDSSEGPSQKSQRLSECSDSVAPKKEFTLDVALTSNCLKQAEDLIAENKAEINKELGIQVLILASINAGRSTPQLSLLSLESKGPRIVHDQTPEPAGVNDQPIQQKKL